MSRFVSPRLRGLIGLASSALVGALAIGRPELAVLAAPFVLLAGVGLALAEAPRLAVGIAVDHPRVLEGEQIRAAITLHNEGIHAIRAYARNQRVLDRGAVRNDRGPPRRR